MPTSAARTSRGLQSETGGSRSGLTDSQLEVLKWIGLGAMLVDHIGRYGFGMGTQGWAFAVGRLAFPLFAYVLAVNLARDGDRVARCLRTARRLALWAAISVLPSLWARGAFLPVNVLATLALGALLAGVVASSASSSSQVAAVVLVGIAACVVEFSVPGVYLVAAFYAWQARPRPTVGAIAIAMYVVMATFNGLSGGPVAVWVTLAAVPLVWLVRLSALRVTRWKWTFYAIYPLHLLGIAIAQRLW